MGLNSWCVGPTRGKSPFQSSHFKVNGKNTGAVIVYARNNRNLGNYRTHEQNRASNVTLLGRIKIGMHDGTNSPFLRGFLTFVELNLDCDRFWRTYIRTNK